MRTVLLAMRADMTARAAMNQAADPAAFKPVCSDSFPDIPINTPQHGHLII